MICPNCGTEFISTNPRRKCCSHRCAVSWCCRNNKEKYKATRATYNASEVAKELRRAARARYNASEKGKVRNLRYGRSEEGKAADAKYRASENGRLVARLTSAKSTAPRRCPAPDRYIASFKHLLLEQHRPCARCGKPWELSHQLDHIVALCNGGKDEESNYQVLCVDCHRTKNYEDLRKMWAARRQQSVAEAVGGV